MQKSSLICVAGSGPDDALGAIHLASRLGRGYLFVQAAKLLGPQPMPCVVVWS